MNENTASSTWIVNTTDATFEQDVIERSQEVPVVLDFWATWCQPCRMLGPILEKLADEFAGQFVLVKADGDQCPQATAQFNIQAYPTVFAIRGGEPVDYFEGLPPEPQLRQWIERILPSEADTLVAQAEELVGTDDEAALEKLKEAVELSPHDLNLKIKQAEMLIQMGRLQEAQSHLSALCDAGYDTVDVSQMLSAVNVKISGEQAGGSDAARQASQANPDDVEKQLTLAEALTAEEKYEEALQIALSALETDKANHGERARTIMVGIFNLLPDDSELTHEYRRKLSAALY